jgi:hypothetical protein
VARRIMSMKNHVNPSGLVAQCLDQLHHCVPRFFGIVQDKNTRCEQAKFFFFFLNLKLDGIYSNYCVLYG